MNIEQLDHVQELPTGWTWASCHINIDAHNSDQLEAVYSLPRGQIRVSDISFKSTSEKTLGVDTVHSQPFEQIQ